MARKTNAASVDDLLDGMSSGGTKKKKSEVFKVDIRDAKVIEKLVTWRTNKLLESEAAAARKEVEEGLGQLAISKLAAEITRSSKHQASISFVYDTVVDEETVRNEINITANKNQWSPIADESVPDLKAIFEGDGEFEKFFEKDRVISMTKEIEKDENKSVIADILTKVFGGDRDKFAKFFQVKTIYKVKEILGESQYIDENVTKKIKKASEAGILAQYKPAFSIKE